MRALVHSRDPALLGALERCLRAGGHDVCAVATPSSAASAAETHSAELAIVDLDEPRAALAIESLRSRYPHLSVVAVSADARAECVVEAMRRGACEVLFKPFGLEDLSRAIARGAPATGPLANAARATWIAEAPAARRLAMRAEAAAAGTATVLIRGEIGTGKTHLARAIQALGPRADKPFLELACGELAGSDGLAALVGRDAARRTECRVGCLERAHGGTLLLENIDELDAAGQSALLGFLDRGSVRPLASTRRIDLDVRVIATLREPGDHPDALSVELRTRLAVISLAIPPLRERPQDIDALARHFHREAGAPGADVGRLDEGALAALRDLPLPGNATELENLMRQARLLFGEGPVEVARLGAAFGVSPAPPAAAAPATSDGDASTLNLRDLERNAVVRSLEIARGNRTLAARALGVTTRTLRNKIRAYGLR